ncbi:MAG: acetate--CoA ligase family protein, partial [Thermoanaerobaculia bacterium]
AYAEWRRRPTGTIRKFDDIDREVVRAVVDRKLAAGEGWLDPLETYSLLTAAGIPAVASTHAATVFDAVNAAMRIGFPVVLKAQGPAIVNKSESGGVRLGLQDERDVREAYVDMQARLGEMMTGALVQQMIPGGVEVTVGATADTTFGHVVVYGAGGTFVELLSDVAFRIHPLTDTDIADMVREVRWSKLLRGYRGTPPSDVDALETIVARISALLEICPEIRELDINPVKVLPEGAAAVDARVRIGAITPGPPTRRIAY